SIAMTIGYLKGKSATRIHLELLPTKSWRKMHPVVKRLEGDYAEGVRLSKKEMKPYEARLLRSKTLPKYDITIKPLVTGREDFPCPSPFLKKGRAPRARS